ncbi:MAG: hypothetical protein G01um101433_880 [Parcubacteria group bacterium Gr01-1014_33]|nr:MAG: hypothetical protein G01um101433_880 [Parcubacteria group bacterium Gr01-1014_33]
MKTKIKVLIITLLIGIPAFLLSRMIWSDLPGSPTPTAIQLPFFLFLSAVQSLLFGFAFAFLIFGWRKTRHPDGRRQMVNQLAVISFFWLLAQWWPHDNFHRWNGDNLQGLLYIDYAFHLTIIIASLIIAYAFLVSLREAK